eukprot:7772866-Lingulodinium_polyedra.AAC.1
MKLQTIEELNEVACDMYAATSKTELELVAKSLAEPKKAIAELISLIKAANKELKQSIIAVKKAMQQQQQLQERSAASTTSSAASRGPSSQARPEDLPARPRLR